MDGVIGSGIGSFRAQHCSEPILDEDEALREAIEAKLEDGCVEILGPGEMRLRPKGLLAAAIVYAREHSDDPGDLAEEVMDRLARRGILLEPCAFNQDALTPADDEVLLAAFAHRDKRRAPLEDIARATGMPMWRVRDHVRRLIVANLLDYG